MYRVSSRSSISPRPEKRPCVCSDAKYTHVEMAHWSNDGHCVMPGCPCVKFKPKGRQEFTNNRERCDEHSHNSGLEIRECAELKFRKKAGDIKGYEAEVVIPLIGPSGARIASYKVDFIVHHNDGSTEFRECKGAHLMSKQPWPLKWALLQDMYKQDRRFRFSVVKG